MEDSNFILDDRLDWKNPIDQNFGDGELQMMFEPSAFRPRRERCLGEDKGDRREVLSGNECAFGACVPTADESECAKTRYDVVSKGSDEKEGKGRKGRREGTGGGREGRAGGRKGQ